MREIKFRGKRMSGGEFVYGYLNEAKSPMKVGDVVSKFRIGSVFVTPESIGQYSGLEDKDNKKIYEGDIIECGLRHYVCEFVEGCFVFRDVGDEKFTLNAIVIHSHVIGNIHDNPELLKHNEQ